MLIKIRKSNSQFVFTIHTMDDGLIATSIPFDEKSECRLMADIIANEFTWEVKDCARKRYLKTEDNQIKI